MTSESGFVWSMNCESCELPKYSFTTARDGLRVDEVVRHQRVDLLRHAHALFDGALHAHETDAVLVLHQLADRADAAVAEVVDVVDRAATVLQLDEVTNRLEDVLRREHRECRAPGCCSSGRSR